MQGEYQPPTTQHKSKSSPIRRRGIIPVEALARVIHHWERSRFLKAAGDERTTCSRHRLLHTDISCPHNVGLTNLKLFSERTQFEFHCPGAAILMREVPVSLRDRIRTK